MSGKVQNVMARVDQVEQEAPFSSLQIRVVCPWCKSTHWLDAIARHLHCVCGGVFLIDPKWPVPDRVRGAAR